MLRRIAAPLSVLALAFTLAACNDTWQGAKEDTGENLKATGQAIEKAGDKVKN